MSRDANERAGGRSFIRNSIRSWIEPAFFHRAVFRERPLASEQPLVRAPNSITHFELRCLRSDFSDRPSEITSHDERLRKLPILRTVANVRIDWVERNRADLHEHLAFARLRCRQVAV